MRITKSFLNQFREYLKGEECGHIIQHVWVDGNLLPPKEIMNRGSYFEFHVTGSLPKDGVIPKAVCMQSGEPNANYRKALSDAKFLIRILDLMGLEPVKVGVKLTKGRFEGTLDGIYRVTKPIQIRDLILQPGDEIILDFKYSGLLDDRWSEYGWQWTEAQKKHHGIQAIQYHYIGGRRPFIYVVVDSSHAEKDQETKQPIMPDIQFFYVPVDDFMIEQHIAESNETLDQFETHKAIGFTPRPSMKRCAECQLRDKCPDKVDVPEIEVVTLTVD